MEKKTTKSKRSACSILFSGKSQMAVLILGILLTFISHTSFAHGTVTYPPSRIWNCYQENPESPESAPCIAAVASHGTQPLYDWSEINQANANGNHMDFVPDGNLASGGRPEKYGGMDQLSSEWVSTPVSSGPFTVTWTISAPHATSYFRVYITNEDWTPDQPLAWDNLTLLTETAPSAATTSVDIPVTLPSRTGKHVIYSVWQRSDSPEAFYSTSDVDFGNETTAIIDADVQPVEDFILKESYPNPFSSTSTIGYTLKKGEFVILKIHNIYGEEIKTLVNGYNAVGEYVVKIKGEDMADGIYIYTLKVGDVIESRRVVLQK